MSSWRLVEAEVEPSLNTVDNGSGGNQQHNNSGRGGRFQNRQGGTFGRGRGGGRGNNNRRGYGYFSLSPKDREYYLQMAVQQIEYIFSIDNLCMDTFLRSYMDVEGYVPIAFACNYQNVACFGVPYSEIKKSLSVSLVFDLDWENETLRLKSGWDMWLMPNHLGGRGVPKYVKQQVEQFPSEDSYDPSADNSYAESGLDEQVHQQQHQQQPQPVTTPSIAGQTQQQSSGSLRNKGGAGKHNGSAKQQQPQKAKELVLNMDEMPPLNGVASLSIADPAKSNRISYSTIVSSTGGPTSPKIN